MQTKLFFGASALLVTTLSLGAAGFAVGACDGDTRVGETGAPGAPGVPGPPGPPGAAADATVPTENKACTNPCHTFNGVVDQWRLSGHSHPQESEVGGGACGNCHGIDGIENRVANRSVVAPGSPAPTNVDKGHLSYANGTGALSEISYAGATTIGKIHCSTCHRFDQTTDPHVIGSYTPGQAPIRVAGGPTDLAYVERTPAGGATPAGQAVSFGAGNLCIFCHKSRKDVTFYITASNTLSTRWGPHNGPQADLYTGKGGYSLAQAGETYGTATHTTIANGCVSCHMQPNAANGSVPDHTMKPKVAYCKTCHATYAGTDFDIDGGRSDVRKGLSELQGLLNTAGLLTRGTGPLDADALSDAQFNQDMVKSPGAPVDASTAGALYNYLVIAKGKDLGVHNPRYAKQLLWDSIRFLKGSNPTFIPTRPAS